MLEKIKSRDDLLALTPSEEAELCEEIRYFLIEHVAQTGGHLASNLGVVELTLALHKVYDTSKDRILFDVGHQAYVHKILTGRKDLFSSLRTLGGLAGFPKPSESPHDAFVAGHASDSVSVALGMARARTLQHEDYNVVAVLGDGALTGGLAYEGLNDAGASKEPMVVVLNDNGMSIMPNVGGVSKYLSRLRLKPGYLEFKRCYRQMTRKIPGGKYLYNFTHQIKTWMRRKLIGVSFFEEMGFYYLGPVDGHDLKKLTFLLKEAKSMKEPVVLHVITKKGKGFIPAEKTPSSFHGVGKFDPVTGATKSSNTPTFSSTFGQELCALAEENSKICAISAAMTTGTGLYGFSQQFPERFFDVGIAEGHAVSMAAGLAKQGMIPVFAVYSTFLQRSYDMLIHDVALLHLHVVLAVDRAGLVGEDGETHHGVFDVSFLQQVPNMQILCPASQAELRKLLRQAVLEMDGPVAIRSPKGADGTYQNASWKHIINPKSRLTIVTYGTTINAVLEAVEMLQKEQIPCDVLKLHQIKPLDSTDIEASVRKTGKLLVVEETAEAGCVGEKITAQLAQHQVPVQYFGLNLKEGIVTHGKLDDLRKLKGLDGPGIYQTAKELLYEK